MMKKDRQCFCLHGAYILVEGQMFNWMSEWMNESGETEEAGIGLHCGHSNQQSLIVPEGLNRARRRSVLGVWTSLWPYTLVAPIRSPVSIFKCLGSCCCLHLCPSLCTRFLCNVGSGYSLPPSWLVPPLPASLQLILLWPSSCFPSLPPSLDTLLGSLLTSVFHSYWPALSQSEPSSSF